MSKQSLAEAVILQAIEDMCANENARGECLEYFLGGNFSSWARLAGMSREDQQELLKLLHLPTGPVKLKKVPAKRSPYSQKCMATASACP